MKDFLQGITDFSALVSGGHLIVNKEAYIVGGIVLFAAAFCTTQNIRKEPEEVEN